MHDVQREQLQAALHHIQRRWGAHAISRAASGPAGLEGIPTGFPELDRVVPQGVPLHAITLLSGATTCGKVTLAYHILAHAQRAAGETRAAVVDLNGSTDADYLARCGVDLDRLLVARPQPADTGRVLLDLIRSRELRVILVDSLAEVGVSLDPFLAQIKLALKGTPTALLLLEEIQPPWLAWDSAPARASLQAALHIKLAREAWSEMDGELTGYHVQATANCKGVIRESTRITRMETLLFANP